MSQEPLCLELSMQVVQDENYVLQLRRVNGDLVHLYCVSLVTGEIRYVLAESEDGAISQASCKCEPSDVSQHGKAMRLPMLIRGWSSIKF